MATAKSKLRAFQMVHPFAAKQILGDREIGDLSAAEINAANEKFESRGLGMYASNTPPRTADEIEARSDSIRAKFGAKHAYRVPPMN